jgi:hypothetical protein
MKEMKIWDFLIPIEYPNGLNYDPLIRTTYEQHINFVSPILFVGLRIVIFNIVGMDYGVFLQSRNFIHRKDDSLLVRERNYFLAFAPHVYSSSIAPRTSLGAIIDFKNMEVAKQLYPKHIIEKELFKKL